MSAASAMCRQHTSLVVRVHARRIMDALFERDPNGAVLAFADMMKKQIVMPAHLMDDNEHKAKTGRSLFAVSARAVLATLKTGWCAFRAYMHLWTCRVRPIPLPMASSAYLHRRPPAQAEP